MSSTAAAAAAAAEANANKRESAWEDSARACLAPELDPEYQNRPITPPHVAKFRVNSRCATGNQFIHTGLDDLNVDKNVTYGVKSDAVRETAQDILQNQAQSELAQFVMSQKERIYKHPPTGRTRWYDEKKVAQRHGYKTKQSESAVTVIFPQDQQQQQQQDSVPPAVQAFRNRHAVNWAEHGIDEQDHAFGYTAKEKHDNEIALCMQQPEEKDRIIPKRRKKKLTNIVDIIPADTSFGARKPVSKEEQEHNAAACLTNTYSPEQCQPDADLGRSQRGMHPERYMPVDMLGSTYGVVSENASGQRDSQLKQILNPAAAAEDTEFHAAQDPHELRVVFASIGYTFEDQEFQSLWQQSKDDNGNVSVSSFRAVMNKVKFGVE
jgi:hypothetical protein